MRKSIQVSLLVMVIAVSAYAGDMQCGRTCAHPPQPATAEQESIQESTVGSDNSNEAADILTRVALNLLAGVLAAS